jgi:hypothetical protein
MQDPNRGSGLICEAPVPNGEGRAASSTFGLARTYPRVAAVRDGALIRNIADKRTRPAP